MPLPTSNLKGDGGQDQDSSSTSQASSFANLPADLQINVLSFLAPSSILKVRETCSSLSKTSRQLSLWTLLARDHLEKGSLTSLPIAEPDPNLELSESQDRKPNQEEQASEAVQLLVKSLERVLISNERLEQSWNTRGSEPRKSLSIRAHKDRITCVKLLVAESIWTKDNRLKKRRWLITGSVDGFVKVFDLSELEDHSNQEERGSEEGSSSSQPSTATLSEGNKDSLSASSNNTSSVHISTGATSLPSLGSPRTASSKNRISSKSSRRGKASNLIAEVDTGGDVTSIDAELSEDCRFIKIASGSYYSSSAASVYLLDLEAQPTLLDFRYSLDPPNWCGTQTVSIREDLVAVGTYTGLIHLFNWRTGWRGGIEREERSSTASVKLVGEFIISITRIGTIEIFSLPTPIIDGGSSESESSDPVPDLETEQGHEQDLPSMSLLYLTDSISNSTHNTKKSQVVKRKAHLLGRFCINEGNKPLLGISIGDTERRRSRGSAFGKSWERQLEKRLEQISLHDAQLGEKDLDRESSSLNPKSQERIIEPLSIYVLDASGLSHLVLDPKISSTSSERKSGQSFSPSTADSSVLDLENEKDHFPYAWPPRIQSHQAVRGERAIGISTGSSGLRAIVLTSLGGVPPICSCRSFSSNRESSEDASLINPLDLQDDSSSETSGSSGYGNDNDRFTTSALLIPIKPTKGVGIPTSRSLETRRFSSSELGHQNRDRSSTSSLTSAAVSSRQLPSAGASAPLPSPTPSPSQAQFSSFNSPSPSLSRTDSFSSNSSSLASSSNQAQPSTNNVANASSSQSVPFSQPSLSSSSRSSSQITSSNLYFNSSSSMQNSTTSFDACVPPSRADIFTEQAFNDTGLILLATARGVCYVADYS